MSIEILIGLSIALLGAAAATFFFARKKPSVEKTQAPEVKDLSFSNLLRQTRQGFTSKLDALLLGGKKIDQKFLDELEELLYTSDLGPTTVTKLLESVTQKLSRGDLSSPDQIKKAIFTEILEILEHGAKADASKLKSPHVILVVGVNGVGKTTSIGKLAFHFASQGKKVLVVAGDTFRAAAEKQLAVWGDRAKVDIYSSEKTKDPAAVAFEGIQKGVSQNYDIILVDTAGRLHTKENLMEELKKVKRVMGKALDGAPNETILVIDANSGQNAIAQSRQFHSSIGLTGLIVTKLDGTPRGGVIVAIASELGITPEFIGVGEQLGDLKVFSAEEFAQGLLG